MGISAAFRQENPALSRMPQFPEASKRCCSGSALLSGRKLSIDFENGFHQVFPPKFSSPFHISGPFHRSWRNLCSVLQKPVNHRTVGIAALPPSLVHLIAETALENLDDFQHPIPG